MAKASYTAVLAAVLLGVSKLIGFSQAFTLVPASFTGLERGAAAWADYDNDGDLDLLYTGASWSSGYTSQTKFYRNNITNFIDVPVGILPASSASLAWGDYDRDGFIDAVLGGPIDGFYGTQVYRNTGTGSLAFAVALPASGFGGGAYSLNFGDCDNDGDLDILGTGSQFSGVYLQLGVTNFSFPTIPLDWMTYDYGSSSWCDYNQDGFLDMLINAWDTNGVLITKLYRNQGNAVFVDSGALFPSMGDVAMAWGDYDNDNDPDLLVAGNISGSVGCQVLRNNGNATFTDINAGLQGLINASVAWGDYDNDGDLDVLLTGGTWTNGWYTGLHTKVYRNDGGGIFGDIGESFQGVADGDGVWADFDNDRDLDFFVLGRNTTSSTGTWGAFLYRNNSATPNYRPNPPSITSVTVRESSVTLNWTAAVDSNQPVALTYNFRLGTSPNQADVVNPAANLTNGNRRLPAPGNAGTRLTWSMTNLAVGTYYAAVQAIDHSFAGSDFSTQVVFSITKPILSDIPNQNALPGQTLLIPFTVEAPGTSLSSLSFKAKTSDTNSIPESGIGFAGSGPNRTLTLPLSPNAGGIIAMTITVTDTNGGFATDTFNVIIDWFSPFPVALGGTNNYAAVPADYDNDGFQDLFISGLSPTGVVSRLYRNLGNGTFADSNISLPTIDREEAVVWGDFNNDNYLDLALGGPLGGSNVVQILRNNAASSFTRIAIIPTGTAYYSRAAWGDFDQDGDLDILVAGAPSLLYWNNGDETFTKSTLDLGTAGNFPAVAVGDYDGDGDLDFFTSGGVVYQNQGRGNLVPAIGFFGFLEGGAAWSDYDGDADLDLAITGSSSSLDGQVFIYRNESPGVFNNVITNLAGAYSGDLAWGDCDNDGDPDLLVGGPSWAGTYIYRNDGHETFTDLEADIVGMDEERVYWADVEGDGDLDVIVSGRTNTTLYAAATLIYRNNATTSNSAPSAPGGLAVTLLPDNDVLLSWGKGTDAETANANSLSYNVRMGTTPGGIDRITPEADLITGLRRRIGLGNAGPTRQLMLRDLPRGTNYWSVQTVDTAFAGSPFAAEVSFVITNSRPFLSPIANQVALPGLPTSQIPFTVGDFESPAEDLVVSATSSNPSVLPNANISLGGTGTNRFMVLTPIVATNASTIITMVLTDPGGLTVTNGFRLTVEPFSAIPLAGTPGLGALLWGDYDLDSDLDLFVGNISGSNMHQNDGGGNLTPVYVGMPAGNRTAADWGDYDGDGDLDLIALTSGNSTRLYRNNGNGTFTDLPLGFPILSSPAAGWCDYDNDGDLDLFLAGSTNSLATNATTRLFRQTAIGQFVETPSGLPGLYLGTMAWADTDKDGDQDLLMSGTATNNGTFTRLYRNDGKGSFVLAFNFPGGHRSVAWGDFDNDGDVDAALGGTSATRIMRNDGGNNFTEVINTLPGIGDGVVAWGDYDNDGNLDLLVSGAGVTGVYRNEGGNTFAKIGAGLVGLYNSRAAWADMDGDADMDFALIGSTNLALQYVAYVFRNNFNPTNTAPAAPTDLLSWTTNQANDVVLTWSPASDAQTTNAAGLNYNLRIGLSNSAVNVMPSHASASGLRRVAESGNAGTSNRWALYNLEAGTYYWSVQAIDSAFAGSAFAVEASFVISNARPTITTFTNRVMSQSMQITVPLTIADSDTAAADLTLSARSSNTNVLPDANLVFAGTGTNRSLVIQSGTVDGNSTITVTVTDPSGAFAFSTFNVTVRQFSLVASDLLAALNSTHAWGDYDGDGDLDVLIAGATTNNCTYPYVTRLYRNNGSGFTNAGLVLPGVAFPSVAWVDYDNDGDLDFILAGQTNANQSAITQLYRNQGNGSFTLGNVFRGMTAGSLAWGDYDNDGDADLLMVGRDSSGSFSTLYRNNGTNTFTALTTPIPGAVNVTVSWGDLDNDGDLDIVVTGGNLTTALYRNNGNGTFGGVTSSIHSFTSSAHALGDYDNDGDLDLLLAGLSGIATTCIYSNQGNFSFSIPFTLPGVQSASVAWGDYDNDGWRDALVTGSSNIVSSRVYRNLGGTNFTEANFGFAGMMAGAASWADRDRDGDLDVLLVGDNGIYYCGANGVLAQLYRNECALSNTTPSAPTNLVSAVTGRNVVLSWAKSWDIETVRSNGLNYALRVGTNSGGGQILSAEADAGGFRKTTAHGLTGTNRWRLQNLRPGTYYWSVQAIDPALTGSAFAEESIFVITNARPTTNSQVAVMAEDSARSITLTGSDTDGQSLTLSLLSNPTNGALTGTLPTLVYRPVTNFFGGDSFSFQAFDGMTNSATATVLLVVTQVQDVATATLSLQALPGGHMLLALNAEPYEHYRIETSQDLKIWSPLTNVIFTNPPFQFFDLDASNYSHRFYRSAWDKPMATFAGPGQFTAGQFRLMIGGEIGRVHRIHASTNLTDWLILTNLVITNSTTPFTDPEAFKYNRRFYRFDLP